MSSSMEGRTGPVIRDLEAQMRQASAELNFERAAKLRDDVLALRTVLERNAVVLDDGADADAFALVSDDLDAAVHVFMCAAGAFEERAAGSSSVSTAQTMLPSCRASSSRCIPRRRWTRPGRGVCVSGVMRLT